LKRAVAIPQQQADVVRIQIGGNDVQLAVGIDITQRDGSRAGAGGECLLGLERAIAIADEYADVVVRDIGGDQLGFAIAAEIAHRTRSRRRARRKRFLHFEVAIAIAHHHRDVVALREIARVPAKATRGHIHAAGDIPGEHGLLEFAHDTKKIRRARFFTAQRS